MLNPPVQSWQPGAKQAHISSAAGAATNNTHRKTTGYPRNNSGIALPNIGTKGPPAAANHAYPPPKYQQLL